eukprot:6199244-Pleurochrysis_carterae.AAC.2
MGTDTVLNLGEIICHQSASDVGAAVCASAPTLPPSSPPSTPSRPSPGLDPPMGKSWRLLTRMRSPLPPLQFSSNLEMCQQCADRDGVGTSERVVAAKEKPQTMAKAAQRTSHRARR